MKVLLIFLLIILLIFPLTRCILFHLPQYLYNRLIDLYEWFFKYKRNEASFLGVRCFIANSEQAMRSGKTLSMVNNVIAYYNQYNNKVILDSEGNKKIQKIIIVANLNIKDIPIVRFTSFEQINEWWDLKQKLEAKDKNSIYKCLFVLDELGAVCNSRQYKKNFNIANIQSILQQGHLGILGILGSSQSFHLVDALMRSVTDLCVTSRLIGLLPWKKRFLLNELYLGHDMEEAQSELMVQPIGLEVRFLYNKNYNCYNTLELANELIHSDNNYSDEEILKRLALHSDNNTNVRLKKKYQKKK